MKSKWLARLGAALLAAALLAGCGGAATGGMYNESAGMAPEAAAGESFDMAGALESGLTPDLSTDRKIIYTADVRLETKEFDTARQALMDALDAAGGYVSSTDLSGSAEDGDRHLYYTVRVPVEHYTSFLADVGKAGNVLSLSESMDDITSQYIDVEARLDSLKNQRDRLNELAAQAETTADLLEIESQLADVQYEIESYTRQMRSMDDQVTYSTINLNLREVAILTPVTHTFADRLIEAFFDGWRNFGSAIQYLIIAIVYLMPLLLLAAVIVVIVLVCTRKGRTERKAAREAARQNRLAARQTGDAAKPAESETKSGPKYQ